MSAGAPAAPEDDAALVARCRAGDAAAWDALVHRHGGLVWWAARRNGLSAEDAAEIYQSVWLTALESLDRVRHPERIGAWLARTAHLQSARLLRDHGTTRRVLARVPVRDVDDRLPEAAVAAVEDRSRLAAALQRIGRRCRDLLELLYFAQPAPSYTEVSARLQMPIGSIGPTRARCLARLAARMAGWGDDDA